MLTRFKLMCRLYIERSIDVPQSSFFVRNDSSIRLCYSIEHEIKYINLASPAEAAIFLKKHGVIDFYSCRDDKVKMYVKALETIIGTKGEPIQKERITEVKWTDVDLTPGQVQTIAAKYELEHNKTFKDFVKLIFKAA